MVLSKQPRSPLTFPFIESIGDPLTGGFYRSLEATSRVDIIIDRTISPYTESFARIEIRR